MDCGGWGCIGAWERGAAPALRPLCAHALGAMGRECGEGMRSPPSSTLHPPCATHGPHGPAGPRACKHAAGGDRPAQGASTLAPISPINGLNDRSTHTVIIVNDQRIATTKPTHTGGQFYLGEVVGYKEAEDVFQVIYDDEASRIAISQGLAPEVRTHAYVSIEGM